MSHNAKTEKDFLASVRDWFRRVVEFESEQRADRKSTRLNSSHSQQSRMPSSA